MAVDEEESEVQYSIAKSVLEDWYKKATGIRDPLIGYSPKVELMKDAVIKQNRMLAAELAFDFGEILDS